MTGLLLRLSQVERNKTPATRRITPPPKKAATRGINWTAPASSSAIPRTVKRGPRNFSRNGATALRKDLRCAVASWREKSSIDPINKLRVDERPSFLKVK